MKKTTLILFLLSASLLNAEFLLNPDENTLWLEDGKSISGWKRLAFTETTTGFSIARLDPLIYFGGRHVPVSQNYPYLVYEITNVKVESHYLNLEIRFAKNDLGMRMLGSPQRGIFVRNVYKNKEFVSSGMPYLRIDLAGHTLEMKYMKMVKVPDQFIVVKSSQEILSPGTKIKFSVHLKDRAEDVSLRFYDDYGVKLLKINGMDNLQLKPENEAETIWSVEVVLENIGVKPKYTQSPILIKAVVLGGGVPQPIWSTVPYTWSNEKTKEQ